MADPLLLILQVLHVAVAATAFGITISMGGLLKRASGQGREVKIQAAATAGRSGRLAGMFGMLTLLTGLALVFYVGGFAVVSPTIHAALALILVMIAHGAFFMRPTGMKIAASVDQDDATWGGLVRRWSIGHGIMSGLWLTNLVLMFIKRA